MLLRLGAQSFLARVFAVAAVALACVLGLSASARAAPVTPFREVAVVNGPWAESVQSDGARYAWLVKSESSSVRVFDTLRHRSFRLTVPAPNCFFVSIGGGSALWGCPKPTSTLMTDLATGRSREPLGIDQIKQKQAALPPGFGCWASAIGRYWLSMICGDGLSHGGDPGSFFYLNYRTGRLRLLGDPFVPHFPFIDLDYPGLTRRFCAPLTRAPLRDYEPPFGLQESSGAEPRQIAIQLRRCGSKRVETLSRCLLGDCRPPQLGSRYVTWGEHKRVYAYLPRIRRRILVSRAPAGFVRGRKLNVVHTCDRIFARWGDTIYEARFEPSRGAPPCQSAR